MVFSLHSTKDACCVCYAPCNVQSICEGAPEKQAKGWRIGGGYGLWTIAKWWMVFTAPVSRSNSHAESMVNCPEEFPFQTWWSSIWGLGWKGIEFQIAWRAWMLLGKFQPSSLLEGHGYDVVVSSEGWILIKPQALCSEYQCCAYGFHSWFLLQVLIL